MQLQLGIVKYSGVNIPGRFMLHFRVQAGMNVTLEFESRKEQ
jgi:hypothetical protein